MKNIPELSCAIVEDLLPTYVAVSYTHLDVYKRQAQLPVAHHDDLVCQGDDPLLVGDDDHGGGAGGVDLLLSLIHI